MDAYLYAEAVPDDEGKRPPPSKELANLSYIDRFGVKAVLGRDVLSYGEIQRMITAENIVRAYTSRKREENWAQWALENPHSDELLKDIEKDLHGNPD